MAAKAHRHKYQLVNIGKRDKPRKVYACSLPDCSHFQPNMRLIIGKESTCWKCDHKMIMDKETVRKRRVHPKCFKCREKVKKTPEIIQEDKKLDRAVELFLQLRGGIDE